MQVRSCVLRVSLCTAKTSPPAWYAVTVYRQNLRNPVREIIAASLHVLGGLLPVHLGVGDDHRLHQSWLWSVGPSVLSRMSSSHDVTGFTRDAVQRYVVPVRVACCAVGPCSSLV